MNFCGLRVVRPATELLSRFRDKQQQIWEDERSKVEERRIPEIRTELVPTSCLEGNIVGARAGGKKLTKEEVEEAVRWHERQRHMGYDELKQLVIDRAFHGLPDFLKTMDVNNIPVCEHCTKFLGIKDR